LRSGRHLHIATGRRGGGKCHARFRSLARAFGFDLPEAGRGLSPDKRLKPLSSAIVLQQTSATGFHSRFWLNATAL
jgi:hypothetical protein